MEQKRLHIVPYGVTEANIMVKNLHRHHGPTVSHKFSIAVSDDEEVVHGAAICGRPVSRVLANDKRMILEVNRLVTDGTSNACSALYSACARIAKTMGYWKIITYILEYEPGISLKAAGWSLEAVIHGHSWNVPGRARVPKAPEIDKQRWSLVLNPRAKPS